MSAAVFTGLYLLMPVLTATPFAVVAWVRRREAPPMTFWLVAGIVLLVGAVLTRRSRS